jgi:hypothetical protein
MEQFEIILFKRFNNLYDTCIIYLASSLIPCPLSWQNAFPQCLYGTKPTTGMSHCGFTIYIKKYLKVKEELWKLQKHNLQKIL